MTLFSVLVVLHFHIFCSPSSLPECHALLVSVLLSCTFLCRFLAATCSSFSTSVILFAGLSVCCLFCVPNHFAHLMFQGAETLTGDMEVHLPRQEQPGGTGRNHQLHNMLVSPGRGLKPQQRGIIFFHKHSNMVH